MERHSQVAADGIERQIPEQPSVGGPASTNPRLPLTRAALLALARRPALWPVALAAALNLAPRGWWRRSPFLPLPDPAWLKFRLTTAYGGDGDRKMRAEDLITWLEWKRSGGL